MPRQDPIPSVGTAHAPVLGSDMKTIARHEDVPGGDQDRFRFSLAPAGTVRFILSSASSSPCMPRSASADASSRRRFSAFSSSARMCRPVHWRPLELSRSRSRHWTIPRQRKGFQHDVAPDGRHGRRRTETMRFSGPGEENPYRSELPPAFYLPSTSSRSRHRPTMLSGNASGTMPMKDKPPRRSRPIAPARTKR